MTQSCPTPLLSAASVSAGLRAVIGGVLGSALGSALVLAIAGTASSASAQTSPPDGSQLGAPSGPHVIVDPAVPPTPVYPAQYQAQPPQYQGQPPQGYQQTYPPYQGPQQPYPQQQLYPQQQPYQQQQLYPQQPAVAPPSRTRRGDLPTDVASGGEIVDLMITLGGYGVYTGNAIASFTRPSSDDGFRVHFTASVLGATLTLAGLAALETPRGVPTAMAIGLRYGLALSGLGYGAFARNFDGDAYLGAMIAGGAIGMALGGGIEAGVRAHPSRLRFVETGGIWGAGLGSLFVLALSTERSTSAQGAFGLIFGGTALGLTVNSIVAGTNPVSVGRGWLLDAAFAAGVGLGTFFAWGFSGTEAGPVAYGISGAAVGTAALITVFALTDGFQDEGWDQNSPLARMQLGATPLEGGAMATLSGEL